MWNEIIMNDDISVFMSRMNGLHDSCIKEIKYISGAYVDENLAMHPINDSRTLCVVIQRQAEKDSVLEIEFSGLKFMNLYPIDENYTCEILDSTLIIDGGCVYWCDIGQMSAEEIKSYKGTAICASRMRWRVTEDGLGEKEYYIPKDSI